MNSSKIETKYNQLLLLIIVIKRREREQQNPTGTSDAQYGFSPPPTDVHIIPEQQSAPPSQIPYLYTERGVECPFG